MAEWQVKGLQLFAALSLLIILHEFGHFFFAKLFKTRVEKFYLFFDFLFPFGNVLPFSLWKKKKGDTVYGIGWFPLGGYVKIAGMVDESMDKEQLALPPQPWEFRSKKAWQRLFIMLGGIIVNVIVAVIIYIGIFKYWGESYLPFQNMKYGIRVDSTGYGMGLRNGDVIMAVDGKPAEKLTDLYKAILYKNAKTVDVRRNGQLQTIQLPAEGNIKKLVKAKRSFIGVRMPAIVDTVEPKSLALSMGLQKNDHIIAVNGQALVYSDELDELKKTLAAKPITLQVLRGSDTLSMNGVLGKDKRIGIAFPSPTEYFELKKVEYSLGAAIARGWTFTGEKFSEYWSSLKLLFTSKEVKASESIGGLGSFANQFPGDFDWETFWMFTAFISVILAFMNLLPIPGLDGGYVLFLLWEMITGRKVSDRVMEYATTVGLILLLGLMLYGNGMDVVRAIRN